MGAADDGGDEDEGTVIWSSYWTLKGARYRRGKMSSAMMGFRDEKKNAVDGG
ncbi:hypothetical protein ACLOJK_038275 [Asimina triloba]